MELRPKWSVPRPYFRTTNTGVLLLFWVLVWTHSLENVFCGEKLALLSATLRTYQKVACDSEEVVIACPRGTSISIEFAQYNKFVQKDGYSIDDLCPMPGELGSDIRGKAKHLLRGSIFGLSQQKEPSKRVANGGYGHIITSSSESIITKPSSPDDETGTIASFGDIQSSYGNNENPPKSCMWPNALQYSLLQTVVEACQKKKHCKFQGSSQYYGLGASGVGDSSGTSSYHSSTISTNSLNSDPCPKVRKIVEIAYKCRPYEFRSKVACHNDVAQLECNPYSRIAIYSASFGRTEYESIQCPQPQGVREETCLASYSTETVMQICHGRRRCNLAADANTFGTPCQKNSRMYLKVVYTCVPMQVLKEHDASETEADESEDFEGDVNDLYDDELNYKESEAIPKLYSNTTASGTRNSSGGSISRPSVTLSSNQTMTNSSLVSEIDTVITHTADFSLEDHQERLYIYLLIVGSFGVFFSIIIVATRLMLQRRHSVITDTHMNSPNKANETSGELAEDTTVPSGLNEIDEIDTDIDLTTSVPLPIVSKNENYLAYAPASSLFTNIAPGHLSSGGNPGSAPGLITAPLLVGTHHSPDLIGIPSSAYVATSSATANCQNAVTGILAPAIVIGSKASGCPLPGSSAISTMVPITSLAQYTNAPTIRGGYIVNAGGMGVLQHPRSTPTPPSSLAGGSPAHPPTQPVPPLAPLGHASASLSVSGTSTLHRTKPLMQLSYDGTAPRTLSTGVAAGSQFYYG
ncbi:uncharacterized protein Dana_GF28042, isoform B [Drosophila ananassae]|uniref:Uncharacterized protein, isoform A n=1 Tax=Drosophila ananassae TaxID=7217 RepID=A0A0P9BLW2_DROAN|nr:uncharacterized protein LOC26515451 [Drosophila ananassae]XP_014760947.1 uncharacterized protein LOC26515451 [Drosophila ananassae]KPU72701.1 uncharacterized protein Dana_GF28042, isoform A [Drosophila ananassae]KPU72702.1 uncharacterized protein Dana_GF28042, isoform B [Drosophila ananassae]